MFDVGLGTLVTYNPVVVSAEATTDAVEQLFQRHDIRHAPVVDGNRRVVGIVSLQDVQRAQAERAAAAPGVAEESDEPRVRDLMMSPVVTVRSHDTPLAALQAMVAHGFHSVPIVADEKLVGIVTSSDFLRELSHSDDPLLREPLVKHILSEKAQIDAEETLMAAGRKLDVLGVDYLAVVSGELPVGYVSRRDMAIAAGREADNLTCGEVATTLHKPTPAVERTARLEDGVRALLDKRTKVALVIDRQNHCRGLLSVQLVLSAIAAAMEHEISAMHSST